MVSSESYAPLIDLIRDRAATGPFLVGVAGPVAVGKTTIVQALASGLEAEGRSANTLSTDAFLPVQPGAERARAAHAQGVSGEL